MQSVRTPMFPNHHISRWLQQMLLHLCTHMRSHAHSIHPPSLTSTARDSNITLSQGHTVAATISSARPGVNETRRAHVPLSFSRIRHRWTRPNRWLKFKVPCLECGTAYYARHCSSSETQQVCKPRISRERMGPATSTHKISLESLNLDLGLYTTQLGLRSLSTRSPRDTIHHTMLS